MEKIFAPMIIAFFLNPMSIIAQSAAVQHLPASGGEVVFTEVKELKEQEIVLHLEKIKEWFLDNEFSYEQIEEDDYSRDKAQGRGSMTVLWGPNNYEQYFKTLKFDIAVVVKKDRYQYRFDHFVVEDGSRESQLEVYQTDTKLGGRYNPAFYKEIEEKMQVLIDDLQKTVSGN